MEDQAKLLADLTAAISSMNAKLDRLHPAVLELNQYLLPGVECAVDAPSSSSKLASDSKPASAAAATSCIDHLNTSQAITVDARSSAIAEEGLQPTAVLLLGAQYDLGASATTGATATFAATAVSASINSPHTRSLPCSILSTGTPLSTPPSTRKNPQKVFVSMFEPFGESWDDVVATVNQKDAHESSTRKEAREVFESMPEPFGQSQDVVAVVKEQKDAWESAITFTIHLSTWYQKFLVPCVPCSVLLHMLMAFEKQRRAVRCDLCPSWPLHVQANFSDWLSIGQLDLVPLFPWNPGCCSSGSKNQINMLFPVTIGGSHWLVPNVCDGPTMSSPLAVLCDEWIVPPWDSGQQANVSYDQFPCTHKYTSWLPGHFGTHGQKQDIVTCSTLHLCISGLSPKFHSVVMRELQFARSGSHCFYLQELQMDRSGIEEVALNSISIKINLCQLKRSESILAYPANMAPYCSCFSSASEGIFCESKLELNNWVAYMVEQYTHMPPLEQKTDLHLLCISTSILLKKNSYVIYSLLALVQSSAKKYMDLCWFTNAILTDIVSIFSAGFSMQMKDSFSVQLSLLLTHVYHLSILAPTMVGFAWGNSDCTSNSRATRCSLQVTNSEFGDWYSLRMGVASSTHPNLLTHPYQLTCDPSDGFFCCFLISLNLHSTMSLADSGSLVWVAHQAQAVFCKTGTDLLLNCGGTRLTAVRKSVYEGLYSKQAWELAMDIYLNSVTWLVVCCRLNTLNCSLFLAPWDPGDVQIHLVIYASQQCVPPCWTSRTMGKIASSYETLLSKELYAPWDLGGNTPGATDDSGLRASRMLRRGECHGPCGLLHWVVWAVARRGLPAQDLETEQSHQMYLKGRGRTDQGVEELEPGRRTLARARTTLSFSLNSISIVS